MGAYQYVALDPGGRERKGVLEGDTARHVRQLLVGLAIQLSRHRRHRAGTIANVLQLLEQVF